jgi:uncharacterized protein YfaS (alpha-2-macroglobulin family)
MPLPHQPTAEVIDHFLHGLLAEADAAAVERLTATDPAWAAALERGRRRLAALEAALPPTEADARLAPKTLARVHGVERARRQRRQVGWLATLGSMAVAAGLLLGLQWLIANASPPHSDVRIIGQQALLADAPGSLRVLVTDTRSGQPLAGVPVNLAIVPPGGGAPTPLARFTTDAQGTGSPNFRVPDLAPGRYQLVLAADTPDADVLTADVTIRREVRLMLSTDKPLYQPGQTVHVRGLALRRPDLKPVADQPATFTLVDPKGNILFKAVRPTSRFGITSVDCPLAAELAEGAYTLRCTVGGVESAANIDVRRYVLPKFKVDVGFDRPYYRPGATVTCTVKGTYFFGQPVAGGRVVVEARTEEPDRPVLHRQTLTTGPDGSAVVTFPLPARLAGRPQDDGAARFTLVANLTDAGGQESGKSASRIVTRHDLHIEAIPEGGPVVPGLDNLIYLYVTTPDGSPVRAKVTASLGGEQRETETNDLGVGVVGLRPGGAGDDAITVSATAADGRAGRRVVRPGVDAAGDFLVRTDRAVYSAGDTMTVTVLAGGVQPVFLDLIRDGQTVRTETVTPTNGQGGAAFDLPADLTGTLELCAYRFRGDGLPVRKLRTLVVKPPEVIRVGVAADKPEYRPGETARVTFTLTDPAGRPAPGALSLAAVDEAVFAVMQQRPGLEQAFYLLEQELLRPVATLYPWSPDAPLPPGDRDLLELALFAAAARTIEPAAMPRRHPHTLTLASLPEKIRRFEAVRSVRLDQLARAWKALGLSAIAACIVGLCQLFGTLRVALVGLGGTAVMGLLITLSPTARVMLDAVDGRALLTAEGAEDSRMNMPRSESRGGPGDDEPIRVRDRFPETLLWRPELITDDAGRAELEVPLADSITTWRLAVSAVTADGRLGAAESGIRVFQPFFVDLDLPVALTRNDRVGVPVVVSNFLDVPQSVAVTLADAGWCERDGPATQTLELPPRGVRSVQFPVRVTRAGKHTLEVTARGAGVGDAVRREITVRPDGRAVELALSGTLDRPANADIPLPPDSIPDSAALSVLLFPTTFSQLLDGLDGIFQLPYGCFEQTSSTTYPNVLALDYLKRTGQAKPEVEAKARQYIALGYQRLVGFEVPGGGFDWYGRAPADVTLTAFGLLEFTDMARVHDVDPALLRRTRAWLLRQRGGDGAWAPGKYHVGDGATLTATAYVARAVFDGSADMEAAITRDYLLRHAPESIADPYTLALVADALHVTGADAAAIEPYIKRLLALRHTDDDDKLVWWEQPAGQRTCFYAIGRSAAVEATAVAVQVLLKTGREPGVSRAALGWLVTQKNPAGIWHTTQATMLALQALTAGTTGKLAGDREREFVVTAGDHRQTLRVPADQADVVQRLDLTDRLKPGVTKVTIEEPSGTGSGWQIVARHHVPGAAPPPTAAPFDITLSYDRSRLTVGDALRATVKVRNARPEVAPMVMLDLPIPGGFAVETEDFNALVASRAIDRFQVTPRQVIVYLRALEPGRPLELKYRLKATMPVDVAADAAAVYEYYDPDRRSTGGATRLVAEERK